MNRSYSRWFCFALLFTCFSVASVCFGQSEGGLPPLGSYSTQQIDSINLQTLNVHFEIPLFTKQARGYNVYFEIVGDTNTCPGTGCLHAWVRREGKEPYPYGGAGWSTDTEVCPADATYSTFSYYEYNFYLPDGNGSVHPFPGTVFNNAECNPGDIEVSGGGPASDDSGYTLSFDSYGNPLVTTPGGLGANAAYDTNGNTATDTWFSGYPQTFTDSTGAETTLSGSLGTNRTFTYTDSNSATQTITANCTTMTV